MDDDKEKLISQFIEVLKKLDASENFSLLSQAISLFCLAQDEPFEAMKDFNAFSMLNLYILLGKKSEIYEYVEKMSENEP